MKETLTFSIKQKQPLTHDAILYILQPTDMTRLHYKPGQFLTFLFKIWGKEVRRSYSLCTCPSVDAYPAIVVKRVSNGEISRYIQDHWKVGDHVEALPPAGLFVMDEGSTDPSDIFLLAAGSGIAPIFGLLKQVLSNDNKHAVHLLYSSQNPGQTIFHEDINRWREEHGDRLVVDYFFSESKFLNRARLHRDELVRLVEETRRFPKDRALFYLCGPYEYMQMIEIVLKGMGIDRNKIRKEQFIVEKYEVKPFELQDKISKTVQLRFRGNDYSILVPYNKSFLDVALEQGIEVPYNCRAGKCSACLATCTSGKVVMSYNEVLTDRDEQKGLVLTCTGHPLTDNVSLVIE